MKRINSQIFIRNFELEDLLEDFFVSAVFALLAIRFFLFITGYPKIGFSEFHIAHMLWGGLFMFASIFILLSFVTRPTQRIAAILGGLGFGTFIDELGKFISVNNNYFFRPTVAIIYAFFVLTYIAIKVVSKKRKFTETEYLINGLDTLKEYLINDLDSNEKAKAIEYLSKSRDHAQLSNTFIQAIRNLETIDNPPVSFYSKIRTLIVYKYKMLLRTNWFVEGLEAFFILQFMIIVYQTFYLIMAFGEKYFPNTFMGNSFDASVLEFLLLLSYLYGGFFVMRGILKLRRFRLRAFLDFKKSVLVNILVVQIFSFYNDQMSAIFGLILNVFLLVSLNSLIRIEEQLEDTVIHTSFRNL